MTSDVKKAFYGTAVLGMLILISFILFPLLYTSADVESKNVILRPEESFQLKVSGFLSNNVTVYSTGIVHIIVKTAGTQHYNTTHFSHDLPSNVEIYIKNERLGSENVTIILRTSSGDLGTVMISGAVLVSVELIALLWIQSKLKRVFGLPLFWRWKNLKNVDVECNKIERKE